MIGANQVERSAYTIREIAALTGFSRQTITRLFEREPGILIVNRAEKTHKLRYRSIRIPGSVFERVIREIAVLADGLAKATSACQN